MAAPAHSAAIDTFEVIFDDSFLNFRGYFGFDLADVSFWVLQHYNFVDIDALFGKTLKKCNSVTSHDLGQLT